MYCSQVSLGGNEGVGNTLNLGTRIKAIKSSETIVIRDAYDT